MTRRLAASALALVLAIGPQPALAAPTLRAEALVASDLVTLGDLIEDAGAKADVALFRAPDLGSTGAVPAAAVIEAARKAGLDGVTAGRLTEITVTRLSRTVSRDDLGAAIAARAADALGAQAYDIRVTLDQDGPLHFEAGATGALAITRFVCDPQTGRFEASVAAGDAPGAAGRRVTGTVIETVEVVTAARALARGDELTESDLARERRPKAQNPDAVDFAAAKGLATRRGVREGQVLRSGDLIRPQHVDRGAFVTVIYAAAGISLSLKAKALQSGAQGDLVAVQNIQSKRTVNGVVTGPSEVTVTAAPTAVARR